MNSTPSSRFRFSDAKFRILLVLAALALILCSVWLAALRADRILRSDLLKQADMISSAVNLKEATSLKGNTSDLKSADYQSIKDQLTRVRSSNPACRFLYLMSQRSNDMIIINVDSEPSDSKDYSPPGQIYEEAPLDIHDVFSTGRAMVRGPYNDRWGTWVSAFVPLTSQAPKGGRIVFGMDVAAADWRTTVVERAVLPVALVTVIVMTGLIAVLRRRSHRNILIHQKILQESESRSQGMLQAIPDMMFRMNSQGVFLDYKADVRDLYTQSEPTLVGIRNRDITPPEFADLIEKQIKTTLETGMLQTFEYQLPIPDRGLRDYEARMVATGKDEVTAIVRDITERKRSEQEKANLEAQLQQSHKMEAIGTLAAGIAHDFNNILGAIIGYTEMTQEEANGEIRRRYLREIMKGAERAKNLVRQILAFSRHQNSEKKPLDIKLLLKETTEFLRASIPATVELQQYLTHEIPYVLADSTQMHQLIINLCTNAAYAMKQNGGILKIELSTIELAEKEIGGIDPHSDLKPGPYVRLTVSDTGKGIDSEHIHRIFEPFFTTKPKEEGTGLGLSVVYGIVKKHSGIITVSSKQGEGTSFIVYLPIINHEKSIKENKPNTIIGGKERILFVDDEPALVFLATQILSNLGYEVTSATSSREALEIFRSEPTIFDLVITDMTIPEMNGIDLSRKLMQIRPDIPIILCSGTRENDTEEQAKSLGIRAYRTKPLKREELVRVIHDTLEENKIIADSNLTL